METLQRLKELTKWSIKVLITQEDEQEIEEQATNLGLEYLKVIKK